MSKIFLDIPAPQAAQALHVGQLYGSSRSLLLAEQIALHDGLSVIVCCDMAEVEELEQEILFFSHQKPTVFHFPDLETLPYDQFSPHQDIVSERIACLASISGASEGVLFLPVSTLLQKVTPPEFIYQRSFQLKSGEIVDPIKLREKLTLYGYRAVSQVEEHGEFSVRGSIVDLYPMGSRSAFRIDFFDDEIETIRSFDVESQRSIEKIDSISLLPAQEYPLDKNGIENFRLRFREKFEIDPNTCPVYVDISEGNSSPGVEYYLPLFFDALANLFDYLPGNCRFLINDMALSSAENFIDQVSQRYESRRYNLEWPLLPPAQLFLDQSELTQQLDLQPCVYFSIFKSGQQDKSVINCDTQSVPQLTLQSNAEEPDKALKKFIANPDLEKILFCAESAGRREFMIEMLHHYGIRPSPTKSWGDFLSVEGNRFYIIASPLQNGLTLANQGIAIIAENQLFGERAGQRRRRKFRKTRDAESTIQSLADLQPGAAVVHEDHGVGRYQGLKTLTVSEIDTEFLCIEYANQDKLYVPVSSLHLISRYAGASNENAPLHRLGSDHWQRTRKKAQQKIHDIAVELLEIQARRETMQGFSHEISIDEYRQFSSEFPFEETPDQEAAIIAVIEDMQSQRPMDRIVCGDVGFGKTEVGMRAAFTAASSGSQVSVLVPTTLLAQQHFTNFLDRFADWPIRIVCMTRFTTKKQLDENLDLIASGKADIVIGTHKLLSDSIKYKNLGLVIIDEEHRFGVRHKEKLKALRANVDLLTMTATPIPRTLNMSLSGMRDLSIIATAPMQRHAIKTFVTRWNDDSIIEGCQREIKRGGQIYFLHNEVKTIERMASDLQELIPEARVGIVHGQMKEKELEQVMLDFYHHRCNLLVCTTIIESGIDVPTANTIFINRADKLGLAQLHQIRGRVGRSHHKAYAYLLVPHEKSMTADAKKRLQAIESLEELGVGFTLATHDLEIRGAGEILGDDQSGQISEIGFTLYTELLERAVTSLKSNQTIDFDQPLMRASEVDFHIPALIPETYISDIHHRLIEYKRISSAKNKEALRDIQIELVDRFGLLPEPLQHLFRITRIKLQTLILGIDKIDVGEQSGKLVFNKNPNIDPMTIIQLIQTDPQNYRFDGKQSLRFVCRNDELEARFIQLEKLIAQLTPEQT
ncbi:MAG: transcription-repair coupling factor (superfamily II helicase) [Gammaproteobacteria bacterium]|jgi:transcription-repair coupling factor (superfamily II helicase)